MVLTLGRSAVNATNSHVVHRARRWLQGAPAGAAGCRVAASGVGSALVRLTQTSVPEAMTHGGYGAKQGDDVTLPERGNSTAYLAARLKRDRPDLLPPMAR